MVISSDRTAATASPGSGHPACATLVDLLRSQAENQPDFTVFSYLRDGDEVTKSITFEALDRQARAIAVTLQASTEPGDRVLLLYLPGVEFISAFFGCLYAGRIAVPLPPPRPSRLLGTLEKLLLISASAEPAAVLTTRMLADRAEESFEALPALTRLKWIASEEVDESCADAWTAPVIQPDDTAFLQYTSGSTALPKGVVLSHANLLANTDYFAEGCGQGPGSSLLNWLPPFHDLGLIYGLLTPIRLGILGYIMPNASFIQQPVRWVRAMSRYRITHTMGPNFAFDLVTRSVTDEQVAELDLSHWQQALNGAEPVRMETMQRFNERFASTGFQPTVFNPSWGLAEASCIVTGTHARALAEGRRPAPTGLWVDARALEENRVVLCEPSAADALWLAASGYPIADTELAIVNPATHEICAPQRVGEVWVNNLAVGQGYWRNPELSSETFEGLLSNDTSGRVWMRTGDLGFMHEGQLVITGRMKDVIIIRGRNHYPQDLEWTAEHAHELIRPAGAAAFTIQGEEEELLCLVLEADRRFKADIHAEDVLGAVRAAIAEHHELKLAGVAFVRQATLPKTTSGKIQRRGTRDAFIAGTLDERWRWMHPTLTALVEAARVQAASSTVEDASRENVASGEADVAVPATTINTVLAWLRQRLQALTGIENAGEDASRSFAHWGLDSQDAVRLSGELSTHFGLKALPATVLFDHGTPAALAGFIARSLTAMETPLSAEEKDESAAHAIGVLGMAGRFPGADDLEALWTLISQGGSVIGPMPAARRALIEPFMPDADGMDLEAGWLDRIDAFDPAFFHLSPREAAAMDPRQRLLLETVWQALEDARLSREALAGTRTGVFVGLSGQEYGQWALDVALEDQPATGGANSIAANRLSYFFDWQGPSIVVDTACSSSLMAVHLACRSLLSGECETAVVATANLILDPRLSAALRAGGMLSPTGRCHSFDAAADGYVRGEGVAAIVLRRDDVAQVAGNPVRAWIAGSACNQDGRSFGLTAPSGTAQRALLEQALERAAATPAEVDYVEAHGTGTPLGDPMEWAALADVLGRERRSDRPCVVGSIKANLGHLEAAAGLAGLVKTVMCLERGSVPPLAGLSQANPRLDATAALTLQAPGAMPGLDVAGVTSMGFGGTNVHVVLRRAEPLENRAPIESGSLACPLSAASASSLSALAAQAADALQAGADWDRLARQAGQRSALTRRAVVIAEGRDAAVAGLRAVAGGTASSAVVTGTVTGRAPSVALVFAGQGSQRLAMGAALYRRHPVFRIAFDAAAQGLAAQGADVAAWLLGPTPLGEAELARTRHAQPSLFAFGYAMARALQASGVEPTLVLGHSLGELIAACVADCLSLEAACRLVVERAALMSRCEGGAMAAVAGSEAQLDAWLAVQKDIEVAAWNAPGVVTVSGSAEAVQRALARAEGLTAVPLTVETGFHSVLLDPVLGDFRQLCEAIDWHAPSVPLLGNLEGRPLTQPNAEYWTRQLREPVRFSACIDAALAAGVDVFIEVAAQPTLAALIRRQARQATVVTLGGTVAPHGEWPDLLKALSQLYCLGASIDWPVVQGADGLPGQVLPPTPFETSSLWLTAPAVAADASPMTGDESQTPAPPDADGVAGPVSTPTVVAALQDQLGGLLRLSSDQVDPTRHLLELGADSLVLTELLRQIQTRYGVAPPLSDLFGDLSSLDAIAQWLLKQGVVAVESTTAASAAVSTSAVAVSRTAVASSPAPDRDSSGVQQLLAQQLQTLREVIGMQLAVLGGAPAELAAPGLDATSPTPASLPISASKVVTVSPRPASSVRQAATLTPRQREHVEQLVRDYVARTGRSRAYAEQYREVFADYRSSLGFRSVTKPLIYPLVATRASGSHLTDLDGHDYIDLTMAFGSSLFGHNPPMVIEALRAQLVDGIQVGPKSPLSGQAAALVSELTGCPRVAFANSGTEAVMTALRLARAVTGRSRVIRFNGAYHGHSDGTLVKAGGNGIEGAPVAPGVPLNVARDVVVLDWGQDAVLEQVRQLAPECAAILVEPIQSRRPGVQPRVFLQALRDIADAAGCALVFDEIITGFRVGAGGAQARFGITADLATYGKVAGGGMPIGIVAGSSRFMDAIDGGVWRYDDESAPRQPHTFFAGTFSANPLAMAATLATLERIRAEGPALYDGLEAATAAMAGELNDWFAQQGYPIRVDHAGSLFRFVFFDNFSVEFQPIEANLFFYHMTLRGVYIWEGHTCFLSTAHSADDVAVIVASAKAAATAMAEGGFFEGARPVPPTPDRTLARPQPGSTTDPVVQHANAVLNEVALSAFAAALTQLGWDGGSVAGRTALIPALGIEHKHASLLGQMIEQLAQAGLVQEQEGQLRAVVSLPDRARRLAAGLAALEGVVTPEIASLVGRCAQALPYVLKGQRSAVETLFQADAFDWLAQTYLAAPGAERAIDGVVEAIASRVRDGGQPLRVLEVGAGTGTVARRLLQRVGPTELEYWFTDISPAFLARAERELTDPRLRYFRYDADHSPLTQSIPTHRFDVVIASNVVHATRHLGKTLGNLDQLLNDQGVLLLHECTHAHAWLDLVFGITDGWWQRDDHDLRPDHALLTAEAWLRTLRAAGFHEAEALVDDGGHTVMRARPARNLRLPMSQAQRQILVHLATSDDIVPAYNEAMLCEIRGRLDADDLMQGWVATVERHPMLRVCVSADGEHFDLSTTAPPALETVDFTSLGEQAEERARDWIGVRQRTGFDHRRGPLILAWRLKLSEDRHWLYIMAHHLIIDGLSYGRLLDELWTVVAARQRGEVPPLKPLLPVEQACAQLDEIDDEAAAWWRRRLAEPPVPAELPVDKKRPVVQRFEAERFSLSLPASTLAAVRSLGARVGATPFMTLNALWRVLLVRLSGTSRLAIGVPVSVHPATSESAYVGFAVNVLPLTAPVFPEQSFLDLLRDVKAEIVAALEHKRLPFSEMVRLFGGERDPARPPLVQVLFNCEPHDRWELEGAEVSTRVPPATHTKYELTLDALLGRDGLELVLTYADSLFRKSTARAMLQRYVALLERVCGSPETPLADVDVLLDEERQQLGLNPPAPMGDQCLHRLFEAQALRTPDAVAIRHDTEQLTFLELDAQANRLANLLVSRGLGAEQRVALCLPRTLDLPVAMLAVLKAGGAYVPVDPSYPDAHQRTILEHAGAEWLIVADAATAARFPQQSCLVLHDARPELAAASARAPQVVVQPRQLAYVIFTSGSTGVPKGVAIEHGTVSGFLAWAAGEFPQEERAGVLASTSVCFDLSVFEIFLPLTHGGRVVLVDNVLALATTESGTDITLVNTVPSAMAELVRTQSLPSSVRVLNLAGEALPAPLVSQIRKTWPRLTVCNLYGPSEDTTYSTWLRMSPGDKAQVNIGKPLPGTRLYLLDDALLPVPPGAQGEIWLAGNGLARGYLERAALTAESFLPDPYAPQPGMRMYRTRDLGRLLKDGTIDYLGRRDDQVKIRGHRVELGAIDAVLRKAPDIDAGAVVAHGDPLRLTAFYTSARPAEEWESEEGEAVRAYLAARLPRYMVPASFVRLDELPLTPNGKIDRKALREWAGTLRPVRAGAKRREPRSELEQELRQRYAEALGLPAGEIGIDDDFFSLGGHSLLATRLLFDLNEAWQVDLRLADLMRGPSVAELSERLVLALASDADDLAQLVAEIRQDDDTSPSTPDSASDLT